MKRKIKIAEIIILGILFLTLFINCDISSSFIDEFQVKIDSEKDNGEGFINDYNSPNIGLLIAISPGNFQRDATPTNISYVVNAFRMGEKEITRAQYLAIVGSDPSDPFISSSFNDPVQSVTWQGAAQFCNNLSIMEGLDPVYTDITGIPVADWFANGYRLPTEMEWMWAAMGGINGDGYFPPVYLTGHIKPFSGSNATSSLGDNGTNSIDDYAVYTSNSGGTTHPVGNKLPNELGLFDMSGNVSEFNWDIWDVYPIGDIYSNTQEGRGATSGSFRIVRGGSFLNSASFSSVQSRSNSIPSGASNFIGFRVVRN